MRTYQFILLDIIGHAKNLTGTESHILDRITLRMGDGKDHAWPSLDTLTRETHTDRRTVMRNIKTLREAGVLLVEERKSNVYRINAELLLGTIEPERAERLRAELRQSSKALYQELCSDTTKLNTPFQDDDRGTTPLNACTRGTTPLNACTRGTVPLHQGQDAPITRGTVPLHQGQDAPRTQKEHPSQHSKNPNPVEGLAASQTERESDSETQRLSDFIKDPEIEGIVREFETLLPRVNDLINLKPSNYPDKTADSLVILIRELKKEGVQVTGDDLINLTGDPMYDGLKQKSFGLILSKTTSTKHTRTWRELTLGRLRTIAKERGRITHPLPAKPSKGLWVPDDEEFLNN